MSYSYQILQGRLSKDVETKEVNGKRVANFTIAVDRQYKNAKGEYDTDFFDCAAWGGTADFISKHFSKGRQILVAGHMESRKWEDRGANRTVWNMQVDTVSFCGDSKNSTETVPVASVPTHPMDHTNPAGVPTISLDDKDEPLPF